jgi:hypothetical protein
VDGGGGGILLAEGRLQWVWEGRKVGNGPKKGGCSLVGRQIQLSSCNCSLPDPNLWDGCGILSAAYVCVYA